MNVLSECIVVTGPIPQTTTWTAECDEKQGVTTSTVLVALSPSGLEPPERPLQRLSEVRRREGISRRVVARRLGVSMDEVAMQEQPSSDVRLSDLYRWQEALGVPVAELLHEPAGELSRPVQLRARLLRAMKTVRSIQQKARQATMLRLVETLIDQLVEVMPELKDIAPWPAVGARRKKHDLGQAFFRRISLDPFDEMEGPEV